MSKVRFLERDMHTTAKMENLTKLWEGSRMEELPDYFKYMHNSSTPGRIPLPNETCLVVFSLWRIRLW